MSTPRASRVLAITCAIFFLSGISGLLYQVIWVRWFGRIFGNTLFSASIVTAVFMGGLGLGSYLAGVWIDRKDDRGRLFPLKAYGVVEVVIGCLGGLIAFTLPALEPVSAAISTYVQDEQGWYHLSLGSYGLRYLMALVLLLPITTLMGSTLTLLIRYLLSADLGQSGWRIGMLYGFNTAGAAMGAFLSDFLLIPSVGLRATQLLAVLLNFAAAWAALRIAGAVAAKGTTATATATATTATATESSPADDDGDTTDDSGRRVWLTGAAIFLSGLAAMGIEILWFRHLTVALGGLRAVFSLLLTVMLVGMWFGSVAGGWLHRRVGHAARLYMGAQAAFVVATLLLLAVVETSRPMGGLRSLLLDAGPTGQALLQSAYNIGIIAQVVAVPAFLMGFAYPLANAHVQDVASRVGRRAGLLYLLNTAGAVVGTVGTGLVLLPVLGIHYAALTLAVVGGLAIVPLALSLVAAPGRAVAAPPSRRRDLQVAVVAVVVVTVAVFAWSRRPADALLQHGLYDRYEVLALSEGINELVGVVEEKDGGARRLLTNGHAMSSTRLDAQRYMRAFSHLSLLHQEAPENVLVICFGVGSTAHSATLHSSVKRLDLVDLSRNVLEHAGYFAENNKNVLQDPRVRVHVNDGRQHLHMQPEGTYDLITLEPPPITNAGVSSLYSRDFYALARSRLREGGFMAQWLPAYQVPEPVVLAMVRAFVDEFPDAILLSGERRELILLGSTGARIELDLERVKRRLAAEPAVQADLDAVHLGTLTEIVGTYFASTATIQGATALVSPVTDDLPIMEYSRIAAAGTTRFPKELVAPWTVRTWCPGCYGPNGLVDDVALLEDYLVYLTSYYLSDDFLTYRSYGGDALKGFFTPDGINRVGLAAETSYLELMFSLTGGAAEPPADTEPPEAEPGAP